MSTPLVRTRIAPSPTGYPHIGTIYQGLFDYVYARKFHGQFLIRIEDTDQSRKVDDAEAVIYEALEYYGLTPDEGPKYGGNFGPYRQSERLSIYRQHVLQLIESGHAYYCFCTPDRLDQVRKAKQAAGLPPMYDQHCRHLDPKEAHARAQTEAHVIRLKVPATTTITFTDLIRGDISFDSNLVDDQVLLKSDGFPTYHLAVVVDDHLMQISHIVRGEEWISSTPKHILLYQAFGWDIPPLIHLPLLRNPDRSKISKRHGHTSAFWYKDQGYLVEAVINFMASRVWNHPEGKEVYGIDEIIKHFKFEDMHIQGPIMDLDKLNWLNGQWIRSLSDAQLIDRLMPYKDPQMPDSLLTIILPLIKDRLVVLSDLPALTHYFIKPPTVNQKALLKIAKMDPSQLKNYLLQVTEVLEQTQPWDATTLETHLRQLQEKLQLKPKPAFMTLRLALTGETATPPLFDVMSVIGLPEITSRLKSCINSL
jgi:glutamyl-tRNA synthetase